MLRTGAKLMLELIRIKIRAFRRHLAPETGQALIEYSLIMCLVVIVVLVALLVLGNQVQNTYCNILGQVVNA
jgi:Flp pilus assembly pilin Flp